MTACLASAVPPAGVYLVKFALIAANGRLLDVVGRREIGFAGAEVDHVDSLAPKLVGVGHDLHGGGNADRGDAIGSECGFCKVGVMSFYPFEARRALQRSRSRCSTDGGTSPAMLPPRLITSFTSFELMNENCSRRPAEKPFQVRVQTAIHQRHLQFVFVIRDRPDAAQDHRAPFESA